MFNLDNTEADLHLDYRLVEVWGASETPLLAWFNADTNEVEELHEDLEVSDLADDDLLIDDPFLLAELLLD